MVRVRIGHIVYLVYSILGVVTAVDPIVIEPIQSKYDLRGVVEGLLSLASHLIKTAVWSFVLQRRRDFKSPQSDNMNLPPMSSVRIADNIPPISGQAPH